MMNSSGKPSTGALSNCRGGESLETLQNEEAIISASSRPFLNSLRERYLSVDQILIKTSHSFDILPPFIRVASVEDVILIIYFSS